MNDFDLKRLKYNRLLLKVLTNMIEEQPTARFGQLVSCMLGEGDPFYVEPWIHYRKLKERFPDIELEEPDPSEDKKVPFEWPNPFKVNTMRVDQIIEQITAFAREQGINGQFHGTSDQEDREKGRVTLFCDEALDCDQTFMLNDFLRQDDIDDVAVCSR